MRAAEDASSKHAAPVSAAAIWAPLRPFIVVEQRLAGGNAKAMHRRDLRAFPLRCEAGLGLFVRRHHGHADASDLEVLPAITVTVH
jgi:hypothetical protein